MPTITHGPDLVPPDAHRPAAPAPPAPSAAVADASADITVRPLASLEELKACVALQNEVWGMQYDDAVPASLLHVVSHVGGIVAGAFAADGELIGFVFGLAGIKNGEVVHWSHALGVRESARNAGVGRMLKQYQRAELARLGIATMYWTFDPLMAKNAHLNLNRLGARVVDYVENMYGTTGSPLHHGLATDRLVVSWPTAAESEPPASAARTIVAGIDHHPVLTLEPQTEDVTGDPASLERGDRPPVLLVEVPADLQRVAPARVAAWHASLRTNFQSALRAGYSATGLFRDPLASRSFYVFELAVGTPP